MLPLQKRRVKLIALGIGILLLWIFLLFLNSCAAAPTHSEVCNSFVGKDYYEVNGQLGKLVWTDIRGDDMIRAYQRGDCLVIIHINQKNFITSWEIKGKCE